MGCAYSNHNRSKSKSTNDLSAGGEDALRWSNGTTAAAAANHCSSNTPSTRIFNVCNVDVEGNARYNGQIEITETDLIFWIKGQQVAWPLKYLRKYGCDDNLFSFECGRRCKTGDGIYAFRCSNAELLLQTLNRQIEAMGSASNFTTHRGLSQNSSASHSQSHVRGLSNGGHLHEYQNLTSEGLVGDSTNFGSLPGRRSGIQAVADGGIRSQSALGGGEPLSRTYLNSSGQIKSEPNYYSSNPLSFNHSSSQMDDSKNSLDESNHSSKLPSLFESRTLPSPRSNPSHSYVNFKAGGSQDDLDSVTRRKSVEHLYENHEVLHTVAADAKKLEQIQSKMRASDDLGTFCPVNFDQNSRKDGRLSLTRTLNLPVCRLTEFPSSATMRDRSPRSTPESYIQLDLKNKSTEVKPTKSNKEMPEEVKNNDLPTKRGSKKKQTSEKDKKETAAKSNGISNTTTTVPYAQIDFAKTMALSNSTANHRKL